MGLLDIFKGSNPIEKHGARATNKRAQAVDRWESIQYLSKQRTPEAVTALLMRFTFRIDTSITDKEEKDAAFDGVIAAGDVAIEPIRAFLRRADSIAWPLRMLERLSSAEAVTDELVALLSNMDTEYERDPEKKIQALAMFEDRKDPRIVGAATKFLADANETVRFHAVGALFAQGEVTEASRASLLEAFLKEESVRTRARILDGFVASGTRVPPSMRDGVKPKFPDAYALDPKSGAVSKR